MTRHGGQPHLIAELAAVRPEDVLDFSASINPDGPPASVVAALQAALQAATTLTRYPDLENTELKQALAAYAGCGYANVSVASGFVSLLEAALRVLPIRSCVVPVPAFNEYRRSLKHLGVGVEPVVLSLEKNFAYACDKLLAFESDAILLANPQNPTGVLTSAATLRTLVERAAQRGKYVLLDEAFIDYAPDDSLAMEVARWPNLIVFRSVTKCFGIPGLRVAYALADAALTQRMQEFVAPWPCTTLASCGVIAAVRDADFIATFRDLNMARRDSLQAGFERLGFASYPAAANYLLLRAPHTIDIAELWSKLAQQGILLRACDNFEGLAPGHLRVAVRSDEDNAVLLEAVAQHIALRS